MEVGEYRVLRKIGEGGMGTVYAAVHPVIGKRVAIKVLAPHIAKHPELVRRFVDEARAVNKIGHPNIVDIFSFGWLPDQRHYFAMEFLDGHSLADRLKRGPFQPDEARRLLRQICQALRGGAPPEIVTPDLKPDNIWIVQPRHASPTPSCSTGIAKLMGDMDEVTARRPVSYGNARVHVARAVSRRERRRARTSTLGMILYEMFAGRLPFQGSFAELITHHLVTVPDAPSRHRPMPRALDQLIMRCLDKDPAHRPQSAEELGRALEAALPAAGTDTPAAAPTGLPQAMPAETDPPVDTLAPPPGRTAADLTIQPARSRRPLILVGAAGAAALVVVWLALSGRHGGGDKGSLVLVVDAQSPGGCRPSRSRDAPTWCREGGDRPRAGRQQGGRGGRARSARPGPGAGSTRASRPSIGPA
jgi:serine/threonine-protein kinase